MAKFKVGDVVSVKREAAEMIDNPALARKRGRVTKVLPGGYYEVDGELGATGLELTDAELTLANSRACNSTNPVVANAMNARNATYKYHDYDVPVIQLGQRKYITIMGVADEETAKAIVRSKPGIAIDESRKVKVKNASGTARNALDQAAVSRALTDAVRAVGVLQRVARDNRDERQEKIAQKAKTVLLGEI